MRTASSPTTSCAPRLTGSPAGRCCASPRARGNAVFLAGLGHQVTAVDLSIEGLRKAERLAQRHGVTIEVIQADLATFELGLDRWSGIVEIFVHLPLPVRHRLRAQIPRALRGGGWLVLETYRPEQLALGTGGPRELSLLSTLAELREQLSPLELVAARDANREIHEGASTTAPAPRFRSSASVRRDPREPFGAALGSHLARSQDMLTNESFIDRALRVVIGIVVLSLVVVGPKTMWGLLGLVPLLTGLVGFCPLYRLLGISTCPAHGGRKQAA
jgi:SAM-dependent methyltransferase